MTLCLDAFCLTQKRKQTGKNAGKIWIFLCFNEEKTEKNEKKFVFLNAWAEDSDLVAYRPLDQEADADEWDGSQVAGEFVCVRERAENNRKYSPPLRKVENIQFQDLSRPTS